MEAVILIGLQGAGKSTFYERRFATTHAHVSLDVQNTRAREQSALAALIEARRDFVVDNTNPTAAQRQRYIAPAKAAGYHVIAYYFETPLSDCLRRNQARPENARIPAVGLYATRKRMQVPTFAEGFSAIFYVVPHENDFVIRTRQASPA